MDCSDWVKPTIEQIHFYFPKSLKKTFKRFWKVKRINESLRLASFLPRGYPLILVNKKTQRPLASIHVSIRNNRNPSLVIHLPDKKSSLDCFQCVLPSDGQLQFTITNLTNDTININLLRSNDKVTEVNPGPTLSINQINELHEYDSYTLERDQQTNKTMIIHPIINNQGEKITMNDLDSKKSDSTTFQIFPSVVPKIGHPLTHLFGPEETEWVSARTSAFLMPLPPLYKSASRLQCAPVAMIEEHSVESHCVRFENAAVNLQCCKTAQNGEVTISKNLESIDTGATYATQVTSGDHIEEDSCETGIEYLYEKYSPPTLMKFSINNQQSEFLPDIKFSQDDLTEAHQQYVSNVAKPDKIYKDDTCCICLDPEPLDVICTCGHVIHKACFTNENSTPTKCPLCRSRVVFVVPMNLLKQ